MVENSDKATQGIRWRRVKEGCQARGRSGFQNYHICSGFQNASNSIFSGFQNDSNFEVFSLSLFQKMIDKLKSMGPNNGPAQVCHIFMKISASIQMFGIHQI